MASVMNSPAPGGTLLVRKWAEQTQISQMQFDTFGSFQFQLADTAADQFAQYFQQYRIEKVELFFRPMYRATSIASAAAVGMSPLLYIAADPNDVSNWATIAQAQNVDGVMISDDETGFVMTLTPLPASPVYQGGLFQGFSTLDLRPWIDTGSDTVAYYGVKWAISGNGLAATPGQSWNVAIRYTIAFRLGK